MVILPNLAHASAQLPACLHLAEAAAAASSPERLEAVVKLNAMGGMHADLAAAACRGEQPSSFIGLWPELAMMNHRWGVRPEVEPDGSQGSVRGSPQTPPIQSWP